MTKMFLDENGRPVPVFRALSTETLAYTDSADTSAALDNQVQLVRVWCFTDAFVLVGADPTATALNAVPVAAKVAEYFPINRGDKVSIIRQATSGAGYVTGLV